MKIHRGNFESNVSFLEKSLPPEKNISAIKISTMAPTINAPMANDVFLELVIVFFLLRFET